MRVALATCAQFADLDPDDQVLQRALTAAGIEAVPAVWDDSDINWDSFALTVVRETWDYSFRRDDFLAWTRRVSRLRNDADVIAWNTDKRYLRDLQARGIPVVSTQWIDPGEPLDRLVLPAVDVVVKPAVSAGSRDTERFAPAAHAEALAHAARLLAAQRSVMVQPYVASVDSRGESVLVYIAGGFSHAVAKAAILVRPNAVGDALFAEEDISPHQPTAMERELAERIMDALPWPRADLLYARIDLVAGDDGAPLVLELELVEPSLFFAWSDAAAVLMVRAIERLIASLAPRGSGRYDRPVNDETGNPPPAQDDPPPDESTLLGASGVEAEVLAEAARAEAELRDPSAPPPDDEGAEV